MLRCSSLRSLVRSQRKIRTTSATALALASKPWSRRTRGPGAGEYWTPALSGRRGRTETQKSYCRRREKPQCSGTPATLPIVLEGRRHPAFRTQRLYHGPHPGRVCGGAQQCSGCTRSLPSLSGLGVQRNWGSTTPSLETRVTSLDPKASGATTAKSARKRILMENNTRAPRISKCAPLPSFVLTRADPKVCRRLEIGRTPPRTTLYV